MFSHEKNLNNKIQNNYNNIPSILSQFKEQYFNPYNCFMRNFQFSNTSEWNYQDLADKINKYYNNVKDFSNNYNIKSQSKLESTVLEDINFYMFINHPIVSKYNLQLKNKSIFAGLKFNNNKLEVITKDVDFCICKPITISIDDNIKREIYIPIISVEVKTYLDSTMFGEILYSSAKIKSASRNSYAYVLLGYKSLKDEHILAAKQDSVINEIFVLRKGKNYDIDFLTLRNYYLEIDKSLHKFFEENPIVTPGKLFNR